MKLKVFDGERFIFFASYSLLMIRSSFFRFTGGSAITVLEGLCPLSNISAFTGFFTKTDEIFRKKDVEAKNIVNNPLDLVVGITQYLVLFVNVQSPTPVLVVYRVHDI